MSVLFSAVVVSAGGSTRFRASSSLQSLSSKQLVEWDGKPLIAHTLEALCSVEWQEIALVVPSNLRDRFQEVVSSLSFADRIRLVEGGKRRQDSVRHGLAALAACDRVAIHDGARPFLSKTFLERLRDSSLSCPAVIPVQRISETVKQIDENSMVVRSLRREQIVRVQTPQIFDYAVAKKIHEDYKSSNVEFTDDAMMFEQAGEKVLSVEGVSENIKVTTADDLRHIGKADRYAG